MGTGLTAERTPTLQGITRRLAVVLCALAHTIATTL